MKSKVTQKRVVGDILKIDLGDGFHSCARVLMGALFAFYDGREKEELPIDRIMALPILFQIAVMDHAVRRRRWKVIGHAPLDDILKNPPPRFIQDALQKDKFRIYENDGTIRPATREECIGLECAAIWDPSHVEDRLRDYYAGRKNKWFESLKIRTH